MWSQSSFLEALLEVNLTALGVSDLTLEHVYNGFLSDIADGERIRGRVLEPELLVHDWKHAV